MNISEDNGKLTIDMSNGWNEIKYCWADVYVPSNVEFKNINFKCNANSNCFFNAGTQKFEETDSDWNKNF